jgi:hypothetical protein
MSTVEQKVDDATHAAFKALGLSVETSPKLADALSDWLSAEAPQYVSDDE